MMTVDEALSLRGKTLLVKYQFDLKDSASAGTQLGRVVGVVVPAPGSKVELQLLMVDESRPNLNCTEGYQFEVFADSIKSYQVLNLAHGA